MNQSSRTYQFLRVSLFTLGLFLLLGLLTNPAISKAQFDTNSPETDANTTTTPSWLEPRGLSIVDMLSAGMDPTIFTNSVLAWQPGEGLVQYQSGSVSGNDVTVNTRMLPTVMPFARCLGQTPYHDQWPIVVPESTVIIRANGVDVTNQVNKITYYPAGFVHPTQGSKEGVVRYNEASPITSGSLTYDNGRLVVPANMGCKIELTGSHTNLTMEYVFNTPKYINIDILGSRDKSFGSYYWPNQGAGNLTSLNIQMSDKYAFEGWGNHDYTRLEPPEGTEYVIMIFPPMSVDAYAPTSGNNGVNVNDVKPFEGSGTYRLRNANQPFELLSVDHTSLSGLPLHGQTVESGDGFAPPGQFLPFFKVEKYRMHAPEMIIHTTPYDPCMTNGGCSDSLLASIQAGKMDVKIYYLKANRILATGMTQISVKQTGTQWSARSSDSMTTNQSELAADSNFGPAIDMDIDAMSYVYLPLIYKPIPIPDDNPSADCPCGWFTDDGRMLDFVESN